MNNTGTNFVCRVSSTLNKDVKLFGKQFMFDKNNDTCWNSDTGDIQWIAISFEEPQTISEVEIQFQGGFAAEECLLKIQNNESENVTERIHFQNINSLQIQKFQKSYIVRDVKLIFSKICDSYGRIIIYHLKLK